MRDVTLNPDPGLFFPPVMQGLRDTQIYALYGQAKNSGNIVAPWFPDASIVVKAAIGSEAGQTGTASGTVNTSLSSASAVGATTISVGSNSGITAGSTIIQIGKTTDATPDYHSEVRKITAISGTGPYTLTLDSALSFAHASGASVTSVAAPFGHMFRPSPTLPSLTIEKCDGGYESELYAGCRVAKFDVKSAASNEELQFTLDVEGLIPTILTAGAVSTPTWSYTTPLVFAEATFTLYGQTGINAPVTDFTLNHDNVLKATYTLGQSRAPTFITPVALKTKGTFKIVFQSLDDPNVGWFLKALPPGPSGAAVQGALDVKFTHSDGSGVEMFLPQINLHKVKTDLKLEEVIIQDFSYDASLWQTGGYTLQVVIYTAGASSYLPL